jgi:hypothetical protein
MFKKHLTLFITIVGFLIISNCSSDEFTSLSVGEAFTNTNIRVLSIDTFSIELSTMKFDSLVTTSQGRLLLGQYHDDYAGTVRASTYFRVHPNSYYLDDDAVLDSVGLILEYDNYFYNDTTQTSTINIHKLQEKLSSENGYLYNASQFNYQTNSLGNKSFEAEPNSDSLYVTLDYNFGLDIFNDIKDNLITDEEALYQKLKGFYIEPGNTDNSAIVGFSPPGSYLRFFYSIPNELEDTESTYDFNLDSETTAYFNNIQSNVSGLPLEDITSQEYNLISTASNNICYNQSGTGYATRIRFPTIENIYDINDEGTILDATLYIQPTFSSYSEIQPIADVLELYTVDQNNNLSLQVSNSANFVYAYFQSDDSEYNNQVYAVSVLDYLDNKLNQEPKIDDALIIIPEDYNYTVNKLLLNDSEASNYKTKLVITYAIYEKN